MTQFNGYGRLARVIPETRYARINSDHIAYQVVGGGPIDLVFMSAWFSHVDGRWEEPLFARMLRRLAGFSRLMLFDKRGTGASDPLPANTTTWEDWADDVRAVMDAAGSERAAIVGVGDSGPIAMLFAATYPERVSSLVLINTAARFVRTDDYPWGRGEADVEALLEREERTWGTGDMLDVFSPSMIDDKRYRNWWARYQRMSASPGTSTLMARLIFSMDVRRVLGTIQVPTLVIQRRELPMVGVEHGRYLAEHIPNAHYAELPGSDYFVYLGNSDSILDEVEEFVTGARHGAEPDRLLATVMFTDIVGSTDRAAAIGDLRWKALLDAHDDLVRRRLDEFRGRLVKTTGDGFLATFDGPARAIRSATAVRDSLSSLGIEIRAGLHTGELEIRGDDVGGIAVHIGARVSELASEREILVSSTVKELVAGSDIRFVDRGTHLLRGIPEQWRLYAVAS